VFLTVIVFLRREFKLNLSFLFGTDAKLLSLFVCFAVCFCFDSKKSFSAILISHSSLSGLLTFEFYELIITFFSFPIFPFFLFYLSTIFLSPILFFNPVFFF